MKRTQKGAKISVYMPANIIQAIQDEAERSDRSVSYLLQYIWMNGGAELIRKDLKTVNTPIRQPR